MHLTRAPPHDTAHNPFNLTTRTLMFTISRQRREVSYAEIYPDQDMQLANKYPEEDDERYYSYCQPQWLTDLNVDLSVYRVGEDENILYHPDKGHGWMSLYRWSDDQDVLDEVGFTIVHPNLDSVRVGCSTFFPIYLQYNGRQVLAWTTEDPWYSYRFLRDPSHTIFWPFQVNENERSLLTQFKSDLLISICHIRYYLERAFTDWPSKQVDHYACLKAYPVFPGFRAPRIIQIESEESS